MSPVRDEDGHVITLDELKAMAELLKTGAPPTWADTSQAIVMLVLVVCWCISDYVAKGRLSDAILALIGSTIALSLVASHIIKRRKDRLLRQRLPKSWAKERGGV